MPKMPNYFGWPGTIWVLSDLHFNHDAIINFERTEFNSIEEHNNKIVKNINSVVSQQDTFVCLGDLGFNWERYISKIKCEKKILILGNHDNEPKFKYYKYFDMVFNGPVFLNQFILLSHEPWPGCGEYCFNIHGHLHNAELDLENYFCVSAANVNYFPVNVSKIYEENDKLKKNHEVFLTEWYAKYYKFKQDTLSSLPIKNHKLIENFEKIPELIKLFNCENNTHYNIRAIDWTKYEGKDLENFIQQSLMERKKHQDEN